MNENRIKTGYESISISDESRKRIQDTITSGASPFRRVNRFRLRWQVAVAAGVLVAVLLIPTAVYAAGNLFFKASVDRNGYQVSVHLDNPKKAGLSSSPVVSGTAANGDSNSDSDKKNKFIRVDADFGKEYSLEVVDISEIDYISYEYHFNHNKKRSNICKDFFYRVYRVDTDKQDVFNLNNQSAMKELLIDGHKALLTTADTVSGTAYEYDYDSRYTINLFIFYEEYGYIVNLCGMQGLGTDEVIRLAGKLYVTECSENAASGFMLLSRYKSAYEIRHSSTSEIEVKAPVYRVGEPIKTPSGTFEVLDIEVSDKMAMLKRSDFNSKQLCENIPELWGKGGKLSIYTRERVEEGNGILEPESKVVDKENIQLKAVNVTMKASDFGSEFPYMQFYEEEDGHLYDTNLYYQYNRPEFVKDARSDFMPFYYRETQGGKSFYFRDFKVGEPGIYHFSYICDGDLVDKMYLKFGGEFFSQEDDSYPLVKVTE